MEIEIEKDIPLAPFTTLGVGGPAKFFASARAEDDVARLLGWASETGHEVFVLGGGSNIVVSDRGFDGLIIKVEIGGLEFEGTGTVVAGAGEEWDALVSECVARNLAGLECLSGIPGTVGGTPVQNVGAYGQEVSETITHVRCYDRNHREFVEMANADCGFAYRKSRFNTVDRDRYVVLSVGFRLRPGGVPTIAYKDLRAKFQGIDPTLADVRDAVLAIRREKSMVIDPRDPNSRSAGSFFKNPIVETSVADSIAAKLETEAVPQFTFADGSVKIPAAWLIEQAGFRKGFALGNVGISEKHALAIINRGGATAGDIAALKDLIQGRVADRFGIWLEPEPIFVGF